MLGRELERLRAAMKEEGADLCLVPSSDDHGSEYPAPYFEARRFLSNFTGSAGTLAVSADWAGLWTDGRYFLQAERQLAGTGITLYRMGEPGVPSLTEELAARLPEKGRLAFDGRVVSHRLGAELERLAVRKGGGLLLKDLPGEIWEGRPALPAEPLRELPLSCTGESRISKIFRIREAMKEAGADLHVVTALDEIAWILNLRGNDVACNPVFLSNLVIGEEEAWLFLMRPEAFREALEAEGIHVLSYEGFYEALPGLCRGRRVLFDSGKLSEQAYRCLKPAASRIDRPDPAVLMKAVKNGTEIQGMKKAHRKDGIALVKFLYWLKNHVGKEPLTELSAAARLEEFRREQEGYIEPSFTTVAAYGPNGAVIHYMPEPETDTPLREEGFFLVDSGGQYLEGTTDVTRTVALGPLTLAQKKHFTAVLKGMLALGSARFPEGCRGVNLDYLAREHLWAMGLDYRHGTGHGVGCFLNVHEEGGSFRWRTPPESEILRPGMVISDEPGVYLPGRYGIRTENLVLCKEAEENEYGRFLEFEFLTLAPIDKTAILWEDMRKEDIQRLNAYHSRVREELSPYLEEPERTWLYETTRPEAW